MQLETKFLRLPTPVTLGFRLGDWQVSWLGGWGRDQLYYLVMVVKVQRHDDEPQAQTQIVGASKVRPGGSGARASSDRKRLRPTESGDFNLHSNAVAKRRAHWVGTS